MNGLFTSLNITKKCGVVATFEPLSISNITNYSIVEALKKNEIDSAMDKIIYQNCAAITTATDKYLSASEEIKLVRDGAYTYYRVLLPNFESLLSGSTYEVANRYFAYNNEVYYSEENLVAAPDESLVVENYSLIWEDKDAYLLTLPYVEEPFFSICKLNNCLINWQKKIIRNFNKNGCSAACSDSDQDTIIRDFLLATVYCLDALIKQNRIKEAQAIVESLYSCNDSLCPEEDSFEGGCGCGRLI